MLVVHLMLNVSLFEVPRTDRSRPRRSTAPSFSQRASRCCPRRTASSTPACATMRNGVTTGCAGSASTRRRGCEWAVRCVGGRTLPVSPRCLSLGPISPHASAVEARNERTSHCPATAASSRRAVPWIPVTSTGMTPRLYNHCRNFRRCASAAPAKISGFRVSWAVLKTRSARV
jgi:hypothetical protein